MTKEDWVQVEKALSGVYGFAKIKADGRLVSFSRGLIGKNRLVIATYIDGVFEFKWVLREGAHLERSYLKRSEKFYYTAAERAKLKKLPKKYQSNIDKKIEQFSPFWNSGAEIRRHYQKTFASIELVEVIG